MRYFIFFDTETQGLPDFRAPSDADHQPHLVQLAAQLIDADTREVIQSLDVIVEPNGWEIPDEAANVHGISTERAAKFGIPEGIVVQLFYAMWLKADCRVAHNQPFDERILRIALKRFLGEPETDAWKAGESECTQKLATPILQLPPTERMKAVGRHHHKSANLSEAYKFFTGKDLEGAHQAMVDVEACVAVYWAITDRAIAAARSTETETA